MSVRSPHQGHRSGAFLRSSLKVPLDMASDHVLITVHTYIYTLLLLYTVYFFSQGNLLRLLVVENLTKSSNDQQANGQVLFWVSCSPHLSSNMQPSFREPMLRAAEFHMPL